ncbi:MAG: pseudouridine synthase [Chitinophagales bacterium]
MLTILYQDEHYVAIDKPHGLLVHRNPKATDVKTFALQQVRNMIRKKIYPIHRLDRATSGVLIFGLHSRAASRLQAYFRERSIQKEYWAIVVGHTDNEGIIDLPLRKTAKSPLKNSITFYKTLAKVEMPVPIALYPKNRYSLVSVSPKTGRMHQIRQHFKHIQHPILGDKRYSNWHYNNWFFREMNIKNMQLLSKKLSFIHPFSKENVSIEAEITADMQQLFANFQWQVPKHNIWEKEIIK